MRYSFVTALLAGASLVLASPIQKRDEYAMDFAAPPGGDVTILNYALTLEYLERKFYQEGLANYTQAQFVEAGFPDPFYKNLKEIYYDEQVCFFFTLFSWSKLLILNRHTSTSCPALSQWQAPNPSPKQNTLSHLPT
jgi:hypothetical protein